MAEWDIFVNSKHILLNHKHTISLKCQRNLSFAVFFVVKWALSAPGTDPFFRVCVLKMQLSAQVLESSHVLEVHLHSASASCSDEALDLASWTQVKVEAEKISHVWLGVVDYIGFPASGMIPENGSWTNISSVAKNCSDLVPDRPSSLVRFFFPAIFIFLDRMLLSSQQEQYLTLKHVKLLPRLLAASRGFEMLRVENDRNHHIKEHWQACHSKLASQSFWKSGKLYLSYYLYHIR